jgi:threonine synthase
VKERQRNGSQIRFLEGVVPKINNATKPLKKNKDLTDLPISFADISRAEVAIRGGVKRTCCEHSAFISEIVGAKIYFKHEFRQFTGSFKERGARNAIIQLKREKGESLRGVIAASAGNHALGLSYHGQQLGVPVTVVMPKVAPMAKVDKCRVSSISKRCMVLDCDGYVSLQLTCVLDLWFLLTTEIWSSNYHRRPAHW